jgi:hypothetical protein
MFTKSFQFSSDKKAFQLLSSVVQEVCQSINSPRSLAVWLLFSSNEHDQLVDLTINADNYLDLNAFADDYLVTEFLSKADFLRLNRDPKAQAYKSFNDYESECSLHNLSFQKAINGNARLANITVRTAEKLKSLLPTLDSTVLEQIFSNAAWGPGVTSSAKGKYLSRYVKLQCELEATPDFIACGAHFLVNSIPAWANFHSSGSNDNPSSILPLALKATPGNKLTTVPKNAKTERTIAVEPHVNAVLQRGIGVFIRKRLLKFGCNLQDQRRNQILAQLGSKHNHLSTIDLKGASDTISRELVRVLVPNDWLSLLENVRSKYYFLEGKWVQYHKHSSMGNGYTFELESAIFLSLALSVCESLNLSTEFVSVYGDDIIIPTEASELFLEMVAHYGFKPNQKKTFTTGSFRESCGADFFNGVNVRPFYIRTKLVDLASVHTLANLIRSYSAMRNNRLGCDRRFESAWNILFRSVPQSFKLLCPTGYGNVGFEVEFDEACPGVARRVQSPWSLSSPPKRGAFSYGFLSRGLLFDSTERVKKDATLSVASALWDMERAERPEPYLQTHHDVILSDNGKATLDRTKHSARAMGKWTKRTMWYPTWTGPGTWI